MKKTGFALLASAFALALAHADPPAALKPTSSQASQPAAWVKLYADQWWYKQPKVPEQLFTGVLQQVEEAEPRTYLRSYRYQLGNRVLYCALKNPKLEELLGQEVEIQGKLYETKVEGQRVPEIWAGAIRPIGAAGPATRPGLADPPASQPVAWVKLYADQPWYKDHKQPEQAFTGVLQRVPGADDPSTLMRSHRYQLGDRSLYPARENPDLEKLVGQKVEIQGKPYDVQLEGQSVREIWPAAVRPAGAATQPDADIFWGRPAGGLAAGVRFVGAGKLVPYLRNDGDKPLTVLPYAQEPDGWAVTGADGQAAKRHGPYEFDSGLYENSRRVTLKPGEQAVLPALDVAKWFVPGQDRPYTAQWTYRFTAKSWRENIKADSAALDASWAAVQKEGVWTGEVSSPAVRLP